MAEYEMVWSDGKRDSNGRIAISPGYVHSPVKVDKSLQAYLDEINKEKKKLETRYYKCFVKWFSLINEHKNEIDDDPCMV